MKSLVERLLVRAKNQQKEEEIVLLAIGETI
jgi:hypothetical protein